MNLGTIEYLQAATSKDVFTLLQDLNGLFAHWANQLKLEAMVGWIAGAVLALLLGVFGYKIIRPALAVIIGGVGFAAGMELFGLIANLPDWMPESMAYICGAILAILFFIMAFSRPASALAVLSAVGGYLVVGFYTDNLLITLGGALVAAMIAALLVRTVFIWITSAVGGFALVSCLSAVLPDVEALQLGSDNWASFGIACGVTLVFVIVQYIMNRHHGERI